jgi:hypothetical protein
MTYGEPTNHGTTTKCSTIASNVHDPEMNPRVSKTVISAGSTSAVNVISLLAPILPNVLPVSIPPKTRKIEPIVTTDATKKIFPYTNPLYPSVGTKNANIILAPNTTNGTAPKTHELVSGIVISFLNIVKKLTYGR